MLVLYCASKYGWRMATYDEKVFFMETFDLYKVRIIKIFKNINTSNNISEPYVRIFYILFNENFILFRIIILNGLLLCLRRTVTLKHSAFLEVLLILSIYTIKINHDIPI